MGDVTVKELVRSTECATYISAKIPQTLGTYNAIVLDNNKTKYGMSFILEKVSIRLLVRYVYSL